MASTTKSNMANVSGLLAEALNDTAPVSRLIHDAGYKLYLVGGVVRDAMHHEPPPGGGKDLDCTTDAAPHMLFRIIAPHAVDVNTQGMPFGTLGCVIDGHVFEITSHRADKYHPKSRKPIVGFGTDINKDLYRRDFTINAMAVDTATHKLIDPCGGQADLADGVLRTPSDPLVAFSDDPVRLLRAARFIARFGLEPVKELVSAAIETRSRLRIVSADRIRHELQKLLLLADTSKGFGFLADIGLLARAIPELAPQGVDGETANTKTLSRAVNAVGAEPGLRWAALFADVPVSGATDRLRALNSPNVLIAEVRNYLTALRLLRTPPNDHTGVRRVAHICPAPIGTAVRFVESVLNARDEPTVALNRFSETLTEIHQKEGSVYTPPLNGSDIMRILEIEPGPRVGEALNCLREESLQHGPMSRQDAITALLGWGARTNPRRGNQLTAVPKNHTNSDSTDKDIDKRIIAMKATRRYTNRQIADRLDVPLSRVKRKTRGMPRKLAKPSRR